MISGPLSFLLILVLYVCRSRHSDTTESMLIESGIGGDAMVMLQVVSPTK